MRKKMRKKMWVYLMSLCCMALGLFPILVPARPAYAASRLPSIPSVPEVEDWFFGIGPRGADVTLTLDADIRYEGNYSLKVVKKSAFGDHVHGHLIQEVWVKPNTHYRFLAYIRGENAGAAFFTVREDWGDRRRLPRGTYDWQQFTFDFKTGEKQTHVALALIIEDITTGLWLDNLRIYRVVDGYTTGENILVNGDFEASIGTGMQGEELMWISGYISNVGDNIGEEALAPVFKQADITVDGNLREWQGQTSVFLPSNCHIKGDLPLPGQNTIKDWGGIEDISVRAWMAFDENNFYFAARIQDNIHIAQTGDQMSAADSVQIAFSKDGISYGPEFGFSYYDGKPQVYRWLAGNAIKGVETVTLKTSRNEDTRETLYEASIPWSAILPETPGENLFIGLLFNENDGLGRRGGIEWTPAITTKNPANLVRLILCKEVEESRQWQTWSYGPAHSLVDTGYSYYLYIANYGEREKTLRYAAPEADIGRTVTIPAGMIMRRRIPFTFKEEGEKILTAIITHPETGQTRKEGVRVVATDPAP